MRKGTEDENTGSWPLASPRQVNSVFRKELIEFFGPNGSYLYFLSLSLSLLSVPQPAVPLPKPPKEFNLLDNKQYCYKTWKTRGRGLPDKEKGMLGNSEGACQARDGAS